jgi:hypothetical protein
MIILGKGSSSKKECEIVKPRSLTEANTLYGNSDLYDAYEQAYNIGVEHIYTVNCFNEGDYILIVDKLIHYNFNYIVPTGIFLSDTFYDPINKEHKHYSNFYLEALDSVDSLSTVIFTERHASLFEDIDHYLFSMKSIMNKYIDTTNSNHIKKSILESSGNDLVFVANTLNNIEYANVTLAAMLCLTYPSEYPKSISMFPVYDIDKRDIGNYDIAYFKYNFIQKSATIDNLVNMRSSVDIYKNVIIDEVIKQVIRQLNLNSFKGKLYNAYTRLQIESTAVTILNNLKGKLFKDYEIVNIGFNKTAPTSGYMYLELTIVPYGTFESVNIVMGV